MKKSLRRALWAGAIVAVVGAAIPVVQASAAVNCAPTWNPVTEYVGGTVASAKDGATTFNYTAAWWSKGADPVTHSGPWMEWKKGEQCGGGTTPTTPPTTTPTTRPPTTPTTAPTTTPPTTTPPTTTPPTTPGNGGKNLVGYFVEWGVYGRNFHINDLDDSGQAAKMTHLLYAFGNPSGGRCKVDDTYAAYDKAYTAEQSVDGVADTWDQPLRGNFNQLKKLKKKYPNLKVIYSFGGWTYSGGFTQAAADPVGFANSCYDVLNDSRWKGLFDGIDVDWEYPNACGLSCDASGPAAYDKVITALRNKFGQSATITSAISADGSNGGKLDVADYAAGIQKLNLVFPMTYDYFGAFAAQGPTAPHSPLTSYSGIPTAGFNSDAAIQKLKSKGVPASKMLLGIGFYGRGWTGVNQSAPGGTATGAAAGTYEQGIDDYKELINPAKAHYCPPTGTVGGTSYAYCGKTWWSYDTKATVASKMKYAKDQGLGGGFFWEASGDYNGELTTAMKNGLN